MISNVIQASGRRFFSSSEEAQGRVLMLFCLVFFTGNALLVKYLGVYRHIDTWSTICFRAVVGLVLVAAWSSRRGEVRWGRIVTKKFLVLRGLLGSVGLICFYWTVPRLGAGLATLISISYVLVGALLAVVILKERLTGRQALWLVVSLFGVALLTDARAGLSFNEGVALLGALAAGGVVVVIRYLHKSESTGTIFATQCVYALALCLPLAWPHLGSWNLFDVWFLTLAGVLAAVGQLLLTHAFRHLTVREGGAYNLSLPMWIALGGFFLFGETLGWLQVAGGLLVLAGSFQVAVNPRVRAERSATKVA